LRHFWSLLESVAIAARLGWEFLGEDAMQKKMKLACLTFAGGSAGLLLSAEHAKAQTYSYLYIAAQSNYSVAPNDPTPIDVPIYLQENSSDPSTSLLANEDGLYSAGFTVAFVSSSGGSTTDITGISANSGLGGFDQVVSIIPPPPSPGYAALQEYTDAADGVPAVPLGGGVSTILLGTLQLTASSTPNQTTTFIVGGYPIAADPSGGNTITFGSTLDLDADVGLDLDENDPGLYTAATPTEFTVTTTAAVVPEPASVSLILLPGLLLGRRSRRKVPV
jgi:hypothetical protein